MQRQYISQQTPLRFKRYSRKGYAAFRSMHREVVVGHVVNDIADRQLAKSGRTAEYATVSVANGSFVADETDTMDDMGVLKSTMLLVSEQLMVLSLQATAQAAAASVANNPINSNKVEGNLTWSGCLSSFLKTSVTYEKNLLS